MDNDFVPERSVVKPKNLIEAEIGFTNYLLLLAMWIVVFFASVNNYGYLSGGLFLTLNIIAVLRHRINGIIVLLLIIYSPAISLQIPNIFVCSALITVFRYIFIDLLLYKIYPKIDKVTLFSMAFIFYIAITLLYAPDLNMATNYFGKYLEGTIILFIFSSLVRSEEDLGKILKGWAIVAAFAFFIKLIHFIVGDKTYLYELVNSIYQRTGVEIKYKLGVEIGWKQFNRLLYPGLEPNYTASDLIFPFSLSFAFFSTTKYLKKLFWLIILFLIAVSVIGTYSRSSFITIAIIICLLSLRGNIKNFIYTMIPIIIIFVLFGFIFISIPSLHDRLFGIEGTIRHGGSGRYELWGSAINMWLDSPLWGNGLSSFYFKYEGAVHNTFLQIMAETGLLGLLLFGLIIFEGLKSIVKLNIKFRNKVHTSIVRFSNICAIGLIGNILMINTITYQDIKLFWLTCSACAAIYSFYPKKGLHLSNTKI